jgi:hypothetical protein
MLKVTRERTGELVRKAFEILLAHPEGLTPDEVLKIIGQSFQLRKSERCTHPSLFENYELITRFGTIAPVKAGWLINSDGRWCVSEEGKKAYARYGDPEQFMIKAGQLSLKGWLAVHLPRFYLWLIRAVDQVIVECKLVRRIGLGVLIRRALGIANSWQNFLPVQTPQRILLPGMNFSSTDELASYLRSIGAQHMEGGHTIYIPPSSVEQSAFRELLDYYPPGFGVKISRNPGGINCSSYFFGFGKRSVSLMHKKLTYNHHHLSLIANLLYTKGLGPRLYDLIELQCGDQLWPAYIIQHVSGRVPSRAECDFGLKRLRKLEEDGLIKVSAPDGYNDEDFQPPACNGNALISEAGQFYYVDFQNFLFPNYGSYLQALTQEVAAKLRPDDLLLLQPSIADFFVSLCSSANGGARSDLLLLSDLLESSRVPIKGKLVLNINCGSGVTMAEYLRLGARWCHGWDEAEIIRHVEKLLLALGCTRFSLTGSDASCLQGIKAKLPGFLHPHLNGCIVSYNDLDGNLDWLYAISSIPMSFLVYETGRGFQVCLERLKAELRLELVALTSRSHDGGDKRNIAILSKNQA